MQRLLRLGLQHVVEERPDVGEVVKKVAYAASHRLRHGFLVGRGHGAHDSVIDSGVKARHGAVVAFPGVARVAAGRAGAGR